MQNISAFLLSSTYIKYMYVYQIHVRVWGVFFRNVRKSVGIATRNLFILLGIFLVMMTIFSHDNLSYRTLPGMLLHSSSDIPVIITWMTPTSLVCGFNLVHA